MSEIQKDDFLKSTAVKAAAGVILVSSAAGIGIGQALAHEGQKEDRQDSISADIFENEQQIDSIRKAIFESFEPQKQVGTVTLESGAALIDQAESVIIASVGADTWNDVKADKYDTLLISAKAVNETFPEEGATVSVVATELDNNPDNGYEYIVSLGSANTDTIPSPIQSDEVEN